jgi:hypothetical protein
MLLKATSRILFFILLSGVAQAQNLTKSPYSVVGIGDMMFLGTARQAALGGTGQAINDSFELNNLNPASYAALKYTLFEGAYLTSSGAISNGITTSFVNLYSFSYFMLGFPISQKRGIGFSAGLQPYSSMGYDVTVLTPNADKTYASDLLGRGGLTRAYTGLGIRLFKGFSVGANMSYLFGQTRQTQTLSSLPGIGFYNINKQSITSIGDFQFQFGAQYSMKLNEKYLLRFGATFTLPTALTAKQDYVFRTVRSDGINTIDTIDKKLNVPGTIDLPASYEGGISLQHRGKTGKNIWTVNIDGARTLWSDFRFFTRTDSLKNSSGIGIGFSFVPDPGNFKSFFGRTEYRLGLKYNNGNINLSGNDIVSSGAAFGLGSPLGKSKSRVNLTFEYLVRGTSQNRLLQEEYYRFTLGITMADRWFVRYQYD